MGALGGRTAIVTGAGRGIGAAIATALDAAGARVALVARTVDELERLAATLTNDAVVVPADLGTPDGPGAAVATAAEAFGGRVDVLVNNAGVNRRQAIFDVTREAWDLIAALNLRVPYELSRAVAREIARGDDGGSIVHIGSLNNAIGLQGVSVYGAHKAGLCQLARSMAIEWAEHGIRVNAICPGFMLTPLSKPLWDDPSRGPWLLERSLLRRPGYPEELVGACLLLASEAGSFITGQALFVEGGWLAGTPWDEAPPAPEGG